MIRVQLSPVEVERLGSRFGATSDRKLRDRLQIVLLAHKGRRHKDVAADLCVNRRTVQRWLNAYLEKGLPGLTPRKAPGKASDIPTDLADEVKAWGSSPDPPASGRTAPTGPTRRSPAT